MNREIVGDKEWRNEMQNAPYVCTYKLSGSKRRKKNRQQFQLEKFLLYLLFFLLMLLLLRYSFSIGTKNKTLGNFDILHSKFSSSASVGNVWNKWRKSTLTPSQFSIPSWDYVAIFWLSIYILMKTVIHSQMEWAFHAKQKTKIQNGKKMKENKNGIESRKKTKQRKNQICWTEDRKLFRVMFCVCVQCARPFVYSYSLCSISHPTCTVCVYTQRWERESLSVLFLSLSNSRVGLVCCWYFSHFVWIHIWKDQKATGLTPLKKMNLFISCSCWCCVPWTSPVPYVHSKLWI